MKAKAKASQGPKAKRQKKEADATGRGWMRNRQKYFQEKFRRKKQMQLENLIYE